MPERNNSTHLSSIFGHLIEYLDYLLQRVLNATSYAVGTDLVLRLEAQICNQLVLFAKDHVGKQGGVDWRWCRQPQG
ncbi:hypothetical protein SLA2020_444820 [Shorea laevis]